MDRLLISPAAKQVLVVLVNEPERKFYVNELIRLTGRFPRSVQLALKQLKNSSLVEISRQANRKYYQLNPKNKFLPEVETILRKQGKLARRKQVEGLKGTYPEWIRLLGRQSTILFSANLAQGIRDLMSGVVGCNQQYYWNNGITTGIYFTKEELLAIGKFIDEKVKNEPKYARWVAQECRKRSDAVVKVARAFKKAVFPQLRKKQLSSYLRKYQKATLRAMPFMSVPLSVERVLEQEIEARLEELCGTIGEVEQHEVYLENLMAPLDEEAGERNSALKIVTALRKSGWNKKTSGLLARHTERFAWIPMETLAKGPFDEAYFREEVENLAKRARNPLAEIKKSRRLEGERKQRQKKLLRKLKADRLFKDQIALMQAFIFLRTYRRNANAKGHYYLLPLLHELACRMGLSDEEIKYLTYGEILMWLKHGYGRKFGYSYESLKKEVARRMSGWAVLMWKGKIKIVSGVKKIIEVMERYNIVSLAPLMQKMVRGAVACRGRATGRVKIVRKLSELDKVEQGDVLVAKMTTPDYMVAIRKAAAIVTDEGGVTCHAAIVSREFNIPCVIGTKNATQTLSDNDLVEVDANEGVVRVVEAVDIDEHVKEIVGKTAYKGKVRGPVRVVLDASDFPKVQEGDILVAPQTTPEYLSSLYKVKGFIVDEESITSHAMLYARALRLPAVIGTEFARHLLQDGERVELDATKGLVKRLGS